MIEKYFAKPYMIYLAVLTFGISFGFTFQLSHLSSVFKFLGADPHQLPFLWLAPPITGLIIQPLIGQLSDDTFTRYGKRRPYIIVGTLLAALSFFMVPFLNSLLYVVILTWLIDASLNTSAETLRALTTDLSIKSERSKAFALQAFLSGLGAAMGTGLPYLINNILLFFKYIPEIIAGKIPVNLKISFMLTGLVVGMLTFIFIRKIREQVYHTAHISHHESFLKKKHAQKPFSLFGRIKKVLKDLAVDLRKPPLHFKKFCFIHAITWSGIFIFWLYFTTTLAQNLYNLPIMLHINIQDTPLDYWEILEKATLRASLYLSIYQYTSVVYSLFLFFLLTYTEKIKLIHALSVMVGSIGMAVLCFIHTEKFLIIAMVAIGIMWGSLVILPYAIVSQVLPKGKFGAYLGIFNISITIPQIIVNLLLSPVYLYIFPGHAAYIMLLAGLFIMISAALWLRESYEANEISLGKIKLRANTTDTDSVYK